MKDVINFMITLFSPIYPSETNHTYHFKLRSIKKSCQEQSIHVVHIIEDDMSWRES